ncbi:hypothetical protein [Actinomadura sp. 3N508]|uniref:hypothetical protein n=1 Tax=Actinomadura sp. 3N508 TaxID=3375153 RepID=UPI0037AEE693
MFTNPWDELNRQANQGCLFIIGLLGLCLFGVWLFLKIWPFLLVALVLYVGYRVTRFVLKQRKQEAR